MFSTYLHAAPSRRLKERRLALAAALLLLALAAPGARAQNTLNSFSSGSTGADGAFSPTTSQSIVVPDSGVFNYTTYNVPAGVTITYVRNSKNKPVTILASGNVTIGGVINVDGKPGNGNGGGGAGGPGGFDGGSGGYPFDVSFTGISGDGPGSGGGGAGNNSGSQASGGGGGGYAAAGVTGNTPNTSNAPGLGGPRYGASTLVPLIGGSGGGGGGASSTQIGGAGGGGGGAILIASSGAITFTGQILARGGGAVSGAGGGGGGSGGAIRLVANTLTGGGLLLANGGGRGGASVLASFGGNGGAGFIRAEAFDYSTFNPSSDPSFISFALPHPVAAPNAPGLRIASVAGVNPPASPLGSLHGVPDIVVPATQANPVTVAIEGANIPVGTVVTVTLTPAQGARTTTQSSALAGTESASTASASVSLPAGMSVVSATATIDLTTQTGSARPPLMMDGERVDRIEVAATFGGPSEVTYVTHSGRRIRKISE